VEGRVSLSETFDPGEKSRFVGQAIRQLAIETALAECTGHLDEQGIRALLLKGAGTARWLYDNPYERPYGDIDLLVAPSQFEATKRALQQIGFAPLSDAGIPFGASEHHEVLTRPGPIPAVIELHHTLWLLSAPASLVWQRLSANMQTIEIAGARINVPSPAAAAFIVGLHAVHHGVAASQPLRDLRQAVDRADTPTWRAAATLAQDLGGGPAFAAGLRLIPAGAELAERLGLPDEQGSRLTRLSAMTAPETAIGIERLIGTHGVMPRLRLLGREMLPSPAFMRVWHPLGRRGYGGLACVYLWRPFWLAANLPRGIRAWLQVARAPRDESRRR
jgi:hypothetical protein